MKRVILLTAKWCSVCLPTRLLWKRLQKEYKFDYERLFVMTVPTIINDEVAFAGVPESKAIEAIKVSSDSYGI